jgi:hypothetical protein
MISWIVINITVMIVLQLEGLCNMDSEAIMIAVARDRDRDTGP